MVTAMAASCHKSGDASMIRHPYMVRITPQCLYDFDRQRLVARPRINHQAHDHDPLAPVARGRAQHKQVPVVRPWCARR